MSCKTNLCHKITKLWLFDCLDIKCPFDKLVIFSPLIHPVIASIFKSKIPPDLNFDLQRYSKKPYIFKLKTTSWIYLAVAWTELFGQSFGCFPLQGLQHIDLETPKAEGFENFHWTDKEIRSVSIFSFVDAYSLSRVYSNLTFSFLSNSYFVYLYTCILRVLSRV